MKKRFWILLAVCLLLVPATVAHADVLIEPADEFYLFNGNECVYLDGNFSANGSGGSVSVKREPGSAEETAVIANSAEVYVYCTYNLEGTDWGLVQREEDKENWLFAGWVPMDELLPADADSSGEPLPANANPSTGALIPGGNGLFTPVLAVILVASLATGVILMLHVFWKPKKG